MKIPKWLKRLNFLNYDYSIDLSGECTGSSSDDGVNIAFNHLDLSKLPRLVITEHQDGTAEIKQFGKPIPSFIGEFCNLCFAKKAILKYWKHNMEPKKAIRSIVAGSKKPDFTPPPQSCYGSTLPDTL